MKILFIASFAAVITLLFTLQLEAQEHLVFSQVYSNQKNQFIVGERILKEAYSKIGIMDIEFRDLPIERALIMSNAGDTDGEFLRIAGIEQSYPNLLMIPVMIDSNDIVVYTKKAEFAVAGWQSLSPYTIGFVRGFKAAEKNTEGMKVEIVTTIDQAFLKLDTGRNDVVVDFRNSRCRLKNLNISGIKILDPPLARIKLYHYVHKRHTALAVKIEEVLAHMERDGELQSIRNKANQEVQDSCQ